MPHPDVPLRLAAPDDLAAPMAPRDASYIENVLSIWDAPGHDPYGYALALQNLKQMFPGRRSSFDAAWFIGNSSPKTGAVA